jgi:hypothetical protein
MKIVLELSWADINNCLLVSRRWYVRLIMNRRLWLLRYRHNGSCCGIRELLAYIEAETENQRPLRINITTFMSLRKALSIAADYARRVKSLVVESTDDKVDFVVKYSTDIFPSLLRMSLAMAGVVKTHHIVKLLQTGLYHLMVEAYVDDDTQGSPTRKQIFQNLQSLHLRVKPGGNPVKLVAFVQRVISRAPNIVHFGCVGLDVGGLVFDHPVKCLTVDYDAVFPQVNTEILNVHSWKPVYPQTSFDLKMLRQLMMDLTAYNANFLDYHRIGPHLESLEIWAVQVNINSLFNHPYPKLVVLAIHGLVEIDMICIHNVIACCRNLEQLFLPDGTFTEYITKLVMSRTAIKTIN